MHSECVARRLARELWDLRQKHEASLAAGGKGERLLDRPDELIEAARIDGASLTRIFISIVIPLARPAMAVLGMLTFMATWNDLFWPLIVWFTNHIFAEDRTICELEQAAFDEQGADWNHEIFPAIRDLRRVLVENGIPQAGKCQS